MANQKKNTPVHRGGPSSRQTSLAAMVLISGCLLGTALDNTPIVIATAVVFVLILLPRK